MGAHGQSTSVYTTNNTISCNLYNIYGVSQKQKQKYNRYLNILCIGNLFVYTYVSSRRRTHTMRFEFFL